MAPKNDNNNRTIRTITKILQYLLDVRVVYVYIDILLALGSDI